MSPTSASTRPAAVAGMFYPASPRGAARERARAARRGRARPSPATPRAEGAGRSARRVRLLRIHGRAGLRRAAPIADRVTRVVLIGPAHRVAVRGVAMPGATRFVTPLGPVELDRVACEALSSRPASCGATAPTLPSTPSKSSCRSCRSCSSDFTLVPLVVGDARRAGGRRRARARRGAARDADRRQFRPFALPSVRGSAPRGSTPALAQVLALAPELDHEQACGATPINALMRVAARRGLVPHLLAACNSGDTAGDRDRVVGYAALAFTAALDSDRHHRGRVLLAHARLAIDAAVASRTNRHDLPDAPFLDHPGATFVTLRRHGELRGCIGSLEAERPLREDVARQRPRGGAARPALRAADRSRTRRPVGRGLAAVDAAAVVVPRRRRPRCARSRPPRRRRARVRPSSLDLPAPGVGAPARRARLPAPPEGEGGAAGRLLVRRDPRVAATRSRSGARR